MKELSIEQKAKAYDEAYKRVAIRFGSNVADEIFLKESEDERIRKALINGFNKFDKSAVWYNGITNGQILAWLEKQGEQKSVEWHREDEQNLNACLGYIPDEFLRRWLMDAIHVKYDEPAYKVEPKFHVGDWVVFKDKHESIYQVEKIEDGYYILRHTYGGTFRVCVLHDEDLRLWTIQDAKDGDVLTNKYGAIFINAGSSKVGGTLDCYCYLSVQNKFCIEKHKTGSWFYKDEIKPATKKQRDLLFQKMKESGYERDAEKKELKKLKLSFRRS